MAHAVEDGETVPKLAHRILTKQGYNVIVASRGKEAHLESIEFTGTIHLLLTDIVMPGMNGKELYRLVAQQRPEIRVLYMSGYTNNAIAHRGVLDEGTAFVQKPFVADTLLQKVRQALDAGASAKTPPETDRSSKTTPAATILVVDDEVSMCNILSQYLTDAGYTVLTANTGKDGIGVFEKNRDDILLVLLDVSLPDTPGTTVLRTMRELRPDIPVIFSSGYSSQEVNRELQDSACTHFLPKPFRRKQLFEAIDAVLKGGGGS